MLGQVRVVCVTLTCALVVAAPLATRADSPEIVRVHGVLASIAGQGVVDGSYSFRVDVMDVAQGGVPLYSQTVSAPVAAGAYSVVLSASEPGVLMSAFSGSPRFLEITVVSGPQGPIGEVLSPRQEVGSVPFALAASRAKSSDDGVPSGAIIIWDQSSVCPNGFSEAAEYAGLTLRGTNTTGGDPAVPSTPGVTCSGGAPLGTGCSASQSQYDDVIQEEELASHWHGTFGSWNPGFPLGLYDGNAGHVGEPNEIWTSNNNFIYRSTAEGGDAPHFHPFRTVMFCRRD